MPQARLIFLVKKYISKSETHLIESYVKLNMVLVFMKNFGWNVEINGNVFYTFNKIFSICGI